MWLIDVKDYKLHYVAEVKYAEPYAILSHTWDEGEVTFAEMSALTPGDRIDKPGFKKIELCCKQAELDGLGYAWVDTCCIDKSSSAELSEGINSMFDWYKEARVCYVYLIDATAATGIVSTCRWFSRGWTLQELIAPYDVEFYSSEWRLLGTKAEHSELLSSITKIDQSVLKNPLNLSFMSIARRMSWAAGRQTTRTEDLAYCLLGLFDVNMPLLYGEGSKAFMRLQKEIVSQSVDHSIFAWRDPNALGRPLGLLAPHPRCFADSACFISGETLETDSLEIKISNSGIRVKVYCDTLASDLPVAYLQCHKVGTDQMPCIKLYGAGGSAYARAGQLDTGSTRSELKEITVWTSGISQRSPGRGKPAVAPLFAPREQSKVNYS